MIAIVKRLEDDGLVVGQIVYKFSWRDWLIEAEMVGSTAMKRSLRYLYLSLLECQTPRY